MSVTEEYTEMSGQGEGSSSGGSEEERSFIRSEEQDDFIKWVSAHEEQVQNVLCGSKEFGGESFCGGRHVRGIMDSVFSRGVIP